MEHFTSRLSRHGQELVNVYMCVGGGEGMVVVGYPIGPTYPPPHAIPILTLLSVKRVILNSQNYLTHLFLNT